MLTPPPSLFGPINVASSTEAESPEEFLVVPEKPKGTAELVKVKLPDETPTTWPALVECVTACFAQLCDDYAGPMQYLNLCYPDAAAREKFGDWLTMQLVSEKPRDVMLEPSVAARGVVIGNAYLVPPADLSMLPISSKAQSSRNAPVNVCIIHSWLPRPRTSPGSMCSSTGAISPTNSMSATHVRQLKMQTWLAACSADIRLRASI